ncbi:YmaF family protein [Selenomonadales bacterium OttesenSCG-928-I06]|nr:YmaF family protein [Selenomonadales bacterium OttesenSCG-928-I06]
MAGSEEDRKNEMPKWRIHVHSYVITTDATWGHQHKVLGISCQACKRGPSHVHKLNGRTDYDTANNEGHWHSYDILTDIAFQMPDGSHVHYFSGVTGTNAGHSHNFIGSTELVAANIFDGFGSQFGGNYNYNQGQNYGYGRQSEYSDDEDE